MVKEVGYMLMTRETSIPAAEGKTGWPWTDSALCVPEMLDAGARWPRISVITPSFNQGPFLEQTIRSVLAQNYPNLEYIIIDGGSTDGSVEIIRRYQRRLAYWISEQDGGQAHAINKGLARASGEIVAYINSDDFYLPRAFAAAAECFRREPACTWLCGDTILVDSDGRTTSSPQTNVPQSAGHCLARRYFAQQQAMFWRREVLAAGFQERWRYCFDFELFIRLLLAGHKCEHLPVTLAAMRLHPDSKTMSEAHNFESEVFAMSQPYFSRITWAERRSCTHTHLLRRSCAASAAGSGREAARYLAQALVTYPEGIKSRWFWGGLRRVLKSGFMEIAAPTAVGPEHTRS